MLALGYRVLARNWRFKRLEIDLICEKNDLVVFVEVKTRKSSEKGGAIGAITPAKTNRLLRAAQAWLLSAGAWNRPCRFDVICVTGDPNDYKLERYPNAINLDGAKSRGHAAREYW